MKTKKLIAVISLLSSFLLPSCQLFNKQGEHTKSFDEIDGKFVLYDAIDKRVDIENTYFEIDGSEGNFSLKYYEHGSLKREGVFQKIITREERVGRYSDNLHFNLKVGDISEHISCYSESFSPIDQFRIIEEYVGSSQDYYLSELPYVLGTYVREGKEFVPEKAHTHKSDYTSPNREEFTAALNGKFSLDEDHYFYFVHPKAWSGNSDTFYMKSYFQYFSPALDKPIEGFAHGKYSDILKKCRLLLSRGKKQYGVTDMYPDPINFGYYTFSEKGEMIEHDGEVNFDGDRLLSFSFEHLSRAYTEEEWNRYLNDESYQLPDAIIYDFKGGTYIKE